MLTALLISNNFIYCIILYFFFQAEDGIRDATVTGVQTCALPISNRIAPSGGLFGGQVGFNWQTGPVVWGVEADWQWANQTDTTCGGLCGNLVVPGVVTIVGVANTTNVYQKFKWFSTARARVGCANDGALIYFTGGGG